MDEKSPVMVLVSMQKMCARLIRAGADMAMKQGCPLKIVHVSTASEKQDGQTKMDAQVLNYLYALANEAGAEMCVLSAEVVVTTMVDYAKEHGVKQIVMGNGENADGIAKTLTGFLPGVRVLIMEEEFQD
ncbi:MAG: hypothetical protein FWF86_04095 [Clostridia bacterium]|nr:hypothetical protein [Clostridia bacterium]